MTRLWKTDVATIYTTHATLLGRHLSAGGSDLYNNISRFNLDEEAGKRRVHSFSPPFFKFILFIQSTCIFPSQKQQYASVYVSVC